MSNEKEFIELLDKEMYELQIATLKNKLKESEEANNYLLKDKIELNKKYISAKEELDKLKKRCHKCKHLRMKLELNIKDKLYNDLQKAEEKIKRLSDEQFETFKEMKEWKWHAQYNQNQKSIEELKKVLENCFIGKCEMFYDVQKDMYVPSKRDKEIIDFIENRIAELNGDRHE